MGHFNRVLLSAFRTPERPTKCDTEYYGKKYGVFNEKKVGEFNSIF